MVVASSFRSKGEGMWCAFPFFLFSRHREEFTLTGENFNAILDKLSDYLKSEKIFVKNPVRWEQFKQAYATALALFPNAKVEVADDPLQMGAMILRLSSFDILVRGEHEIAQFKALISDADNFEIYADKGNIRFAAVFQKVLSRIG